MLKPLIVLGSEPDKLFDDNVNDLCRQPDHIMAVNTSPLGFRDVDLNTP